MKQYTQLDHEQRYQISGLHKAGWNQTQIADEIGVHKSTIHESSVETRGSVVGALDRHSQCVMSVGTPVSTASKSH